MAKKSIWFGRNLYVISTDKSYAGVYVTPRKLKRIWRNGNIVERNGSKLI